MNIKTIKLQSGEEFMGELVEDLLDSIRVKKPVILIQTANGHAFTPWIQTTLDDEFTIDRDKVMFILTPLAELEEAYNHQFGTIMTKPTSIITG